MREWISSTVFSHLPCRCISVQWLFTEEIVTVTLTSFCRHEKAAEERQGQRLTHTLHKVEVSGFPQSTKHHVSTQKKRAICISHRLNLSPAQPSEASLQSQAHSLEHSIKHSGNSELQAPTNSSRKFKWREQFLTDFVNLAPY